MSQIWLITGANSGFGREITGCALAAGDRVIAIIRRLASVADIQREYPETFFPYYAEISQTKQIEPLMHTIIEKHGYIDIVVNNAGKGIIGAAEEISEDEFRYLMDLHLFGPVALIQAILPTMRERKSGTIVQMSSQGGRYSFPGVGVYSATKFALEGYSEALAMECKPYNINVIIAEPGAFRTSFNNPGVIQFASEHDAYVDIVGPIKKALSDVDGKQPGDPQKAAQAIVNTVKSEAPPLRLALGSDAVDSITESLEKSLCEIQQWESISRSADFIKS